VSNVKLKEEGKLEKEIKAKHPIKARELNHNERIIEKVAGRKTKRKINFQKLYENNKTQTHHGFRSGSLSLPGMAENLFIEEEIEDRKT
jgi:hypothetical protein